MAEETFEVMISDKQYKELKLLKQKNVDLLLSIKTQQQKIAHLELQTQEQVRIITKKDLEIRFLVELIQSIAVGQSLQDDNDPSNSRTNSFEVLGQSIREPQKAEEQMRSAVRQQFPKKYRDLMQKAADLEDRFESQEELIKKLNQMNAQKNDALVKANQKGDPERISSMEKEILELNRELRTLRSENVEIKKKFDKKTAQVDKKLSQVDKNSEKLLKEVQKEGEKQKAEKEAAINKLKEIEGKLRGFEMQNLALRQQVDKKAINCKADSRVNIKRVVDDFVRQVETNLNGIEELSSNERRQLISHQMKELSDYVLKAFAKK